jgi:hypothetical protein
MKTFNEFMEEFRYLPKAKMDKKIKDRKNKGEGNTSKTEKMKLVRNVLGKSTNLTKSDSMKNAENNKKMLNKRIQSNNPSEDKISTSLKTAEKQKNIIKTRDLKSNKKNPTEHDKFKREYELIKQDVKNRSETDSKKIISARKRLEKSYDKSIGEKLYFDNFDDILENIEMTESICKNILKYM